MCAARQRNREREAGRRRVISGHPHAEEPIMPITLRPHPTRRSVLYLAGGAAAFAALAARPLAGLAQTEQAGHPVMFSSRHPEQLKDLVAGLGPLAKAGTVAEAVAFGEVVLLVVPYPAVPEIGKEYGGALATKPLVIDVSNPSAARDGEDIVKWVDEQGGAGLPPDQGDRFRAGRRRRPRHGQISGAEDAARRRAYARGDPPDRRDPEVGR